MGHPDNSRVTGRVGGARGHEIELLKWYIAHSELSDLVRNELSGNQMAATALRTAYELDRFKMSKFLYHLPIQARTQPLSQQDIAAGRTRPSPDVRRPYCSCVARGHLTLGATCLYEGQTPPPDHEWHWLRCPCLINADPDTGVTSRMCRYGSTPPAGHLICPLPDIFMGETDGKGRRHQQMDTMDMEPLTRPHDAPLVRPMTEDDVSISRVPSPLVRGERAAYVRFAVEQKLIEPARAVAIEPALLRAPPHVWYQLPAQARTLLEPLRNAREDEMLMDHRLLFGRWTPTFQPELAYASPMSWADEAGMTSQLLADGANKLTELAAARDAAVAAGPFSS
jgi:hypothetical protein